MELHQVFPALLGLASFITHLWLCWRLWGWLE